MHHLRKLLVLGVNELLARGEVQLDGPSKNDHDDYGHIFWDIAGENSVVAWTNIGSQELRVSVWWKYDHEKHPQKDAPGNAQECFRTSRPLAKEQHYPKFVGAFASGWLERETGKYLQGRGPTGIFDKYVRRNELDALKQLADPIPAGFASEGDLH